MADDKDKKEEKEEKKSGGSGKDKMEAFLKGNESMKGMSVSSILFFAAVAGVVLGAMFLIATILNPVGQRNLQTGFSLTREILAVILSVGGTLWLIGGVGSATQTKDRVMACVPGIMIILGAVTLTGAASWGGPIALALIIGALVISDAKAGKK